MSPSWRDRLLIGLAPDRVAAVHVKRGLRPSLGSDGVRDCASVSDGAAAWAGALAALDELLAELAVTGEARVVVSNHFVRYVAVPWTDGVFAAEDRLSLAAGCFRSTFGDLVDAWRIVVGPPRYGCANLAAAVDRALVDALRSTLGRRRLTLTTLRPHLSAAFDRCRARLEEDDGGFALVEPGCVTALFRRGGQWSEVSNRRCGRQGAEETAQVVRQCADADQVLGGTGGVALLAPGLPLPADAAGGRGLRRLDGHDGQGGPWPGDPWRSMAWSAA